MNTTVNHFNSMEQVMIVLKDHFIELDNERMKQSICIDQMIRGDISTKKTSTNFFTL